MSLYEGRSAQSGRAVLLASLLALAIAPAARAAPPPLVSPAAPYANCGWLTENDQAAYIQSLADFDPADLSRSLAKPPSPGLVTAVVCRRNSILPDLSDYRILSDLKLPLIIQDGARTVVIESNGDNLSIGLAVGPILSPAELNTATERLNLLRTAFAADKAAAPPPPAPPEVDLTRAYTPADLAVLLRLIGAAGVPENLGGLPLEMGGKDWFSGCPLGAQGRFTKALAAHLNQEKATLQTRVAARFDPAFSHDELVILNRYFQLVPMTISTAGGARPRTTKLTSAQIAQADSLENSPVVQRFVSELPPNMGPVFERLAALGTASLNETCPANKAKPLPNPMAPPDVKYHPVAPFRPQAWEVKFGP